MGGLVMKKVLISVAFIFISLFFVSCIQNTSEINEEIYAIYELAVDAGVTLTYQEWLETVEGESGLPGENGREITLQLNEEGILQWQYEGDELWTDLLDSSILQGINGADGINGLNGADGKEIILRVEQDVLQWQYVGDELWTNLTIMESVESGFYLTDDEINNVLQNYDADVESLFPTIDLETLKSEPYTNNSTTQIYQESNSNENYPMIFSEGYEKFVDKQNSTYLLVYAMSAISDLMGEYDSEPVVPTNYLSGSNVLSDVVGRNNTSILFEGTLDGSIPLSIPFDLEFTYQLLIYKNVEDNSIYVEGNILFEAGLLILNVELSNITFVLTYDMWNELESLVYTTDVVALKEWVTIIKPTINGVEIYSTNQDKIEYFVTQENILEILYSSNWFDEIADYKYERYNNNEFVYKLIKETDETYYELPFSTVTGWDLVEFTNDYNFFDNDLSYRISLNEVIIREDLKSESEIELEEVWIQTQDFKYFYNNEGELEKNNLSNVIIINTISKTSLTTYFGSDLQYEPILNLEEYLLVKGNIENYSFLTYFESTQNFDDIYNKFNLRDK